MARGKYGRIVGRKYSGGQRLVGGLGYWREHAWNPYGWSPERMSLGQRQELHHILDWCRRPVSTPVEMMVKFAVRKFLDGIDPEPLLLAKGIEPYILRIAMKRARVFIGNERSKRRNQAAVEKILASRRTSILPTFTSENIHVTIDHTQDRNYGMAQSSIYCIVEVWESGVGSDDVEKEYLVNFSDYMVKEWLTKLLVWGLMNKKEILIKPATEVEMSSMKMFVPRSGAAVA